MKNHQMRLDHLKQLGFAPSGVLDIGAHRGTWTLAARQVWTDAYYLLLEADLQHEETLRAITSTTPNADVEIVLLGDENKERAEFFRGTSEYTSGNSIYEEQTTIDFERAFIPMRCLDDVLARREARQYELIKLDVQGAELDVLKGGPTAVRGAEFILLEVPVLEYNKGSPAFDEIIAFMTDRGFVIHDIVDLTYCPDQTLCQMDVLFVRRESSFVKRGILF